MRKKDAQKTTIESDDPITEKDVQPGFTSDTINDLYNWPRTFISDNGHVKAEMPHQGCSKSKKRWIIEFMEHVRPNKADIHHSNPKLEGK